MAINLKNRFMVSAIAFALVLITITVLIVVPYAQEIRLINEQVYEERVRLEKLYETGQIKKTVQQNYNKIKDNLGFLDDMMLKENQELQYITSIERIADEAQVGIEMSAGETKRVPQQRFSEIHFSFAINGKLDNIARFLTELEKLPFYTNIGQITISVRNAQADSNTREAAVSMQANTFWLVPTN